MQQKWERNDNLLLPCFVPVLYTIWWVCLLSGLPIPWSSYSRVIQFASFPSLGRSSWGLRWCLVFVCFAPRSDGSIWKKKTLMAWLGAAAVGEQLNFEYILRWINCLYGSRNELTRSCGFVSIHILKIIFVWPIWVLLNKVRKPMLIKIVHT